MKIFLVGVFALASATCIGTGAYMAYLGKPQWGWLIIAGIVILGAINYEEKSN